MSSVVSLQETQVLQAVAQKRVKVPPTGVSLSLSISISANESTLNTSPWALGKYENIN